MTLYSLNSRIIFFQGKLGGNAGGGGEGGYSAEYQAVYDSFDTAPSDEIAVYQNTLVESLVSDGIWAKQDCFYVFANNTEANSLINWKDPGTYDCTVVETPTFTTMEGWQDTTNSNGLDSNFAPIDGGNFLQESGHFGTYLRSTTSWTSFFMGDATPHNILGGTAFYGTNANDNDNPNWSPFVGGLHMATRAVGSIKEAWRNGIRTLNVSNDTFGGATPLSVKSITFGGYNTGVINGTCYAQHSIGSIGGNLDQTENTNLFNAIETYMDAIGKGVVA